ncbi:hypothetical protein GCM10028796_48200 [Ramlibacter monticola]|nr:spore coat protein U domain-containing protein [Ramlibacter monticola]
MTRLLSVVCCALLPLAAGAQAGRRSSACPVRPAECQLSTPVYSFGRHVMGANASPIFAESTISITCTRTNADGFRMDVDYELQGLPAEPDREMRHRDPGTLHYDLFVDAGRKQHWGDGKGGTKTVKDSLELSDNNRVVTRTHKIYGTVYGQQQVDTGQWLGFVSVRLEYEIKRCR